jgi:hypothetical protein
MLAALTISASVGSVTSAHASTVTPSLKERLAAQHKEINRLTVLSVNRGYWLGLIVKHGNGGATSTSLPYLRWVHTFWLVRAHNYRVAIAKRAPQYSVLSCIHGIEGSWTAYNPAGPYYGGLQMSATFEVHWGSAAVAHWGDARHWPAGMQMAVGYRAVQQLGYTPWSSSAAACGH